MLISHSQDYSPCFVCSFLSFFDASRLRYILFRVLSGLYLSVPLGRKRAARFLASRLFKKSRFGIDLV
jgi:hypothetical protein